jgi:hypothetical protein
VSDFLYKVVARLHLAEQARVTKPIGIQSVSFSNSDWSLALYRFHCRFKRKCAYKGSINLEADLDFEHVQWLREFKTNLDFAVQNSGVFANSNLSIEELGGLSWCKTMVKSGQVVITKADKGRQWVVANRTDYVAAMRDFLNNSGNYQLVQFNSKFRTAALIIKLVNEFSSLFDANTKACLLSNTKHPRTRNIYGLPKVHKHKTGCNNNFPPIRPICPDVDTETAFSARYLALALLPLAEMGNSYFKSSAVLVSELFQLRNLPCSSVLVTVDIEALYPSIPPLEAYRVVELELELRNNTPNSATPQRHLNFLLQLLKIHLLENTVEFEGQCFKQVSGLPMGRAWAPAVANVFMNHWERLLFSQLPSTPVVFKRYLDDILTVADSVESAECLINTMRNTLPYIKIGTCLVGVRVNYLDLQLSLVRNDTPNTRLPFLSHIGICRYTYPNTLVSLKSELFRKPSDLIVLLDFKSNHPMHVVQGTLFGQLVRILNISSSLRSAGYHARVLLELMILLRNMRSNLRWKLHRRVLQYLVRRATNWALHTVHTERTDKKRLRDILMFVPKLVDAHFLTRVIRDFNSRLSVSEQRYVNARVHMQYTHNLLRILKL